MIKCSNDHKNELLEFLVINPTENCFFIGDIENFSIDDNFMDIWKFEEKGKITSLLLRYYKYYLVYSESDGDLNEIAEIINRDKEALLLSGLELTIDKLSKIVELNKIKRSFLAELNADTFIQLPTNLFPVKAAVENINELFDFQKSIEEFDFTERNRDSFGKEIKTDTGKVYYIRQNGKIVSSATITAENSLNGMIIGVATDKNFRNKGYAKACILELCREMIGQGKKVVLFYNNPDAGKLYKSIGFADVNNWAMGAIH